MANPPPPKMPAPPPKPVPAWRVKTRKAVVPLLAALVAAGFVQVAFGGMAALQGEPNSITMHTDVVVHVVELLVYALIAVGFLGRDPWVGGAAVVLFFLIGAQYALINDDTDLRGLHVANGVLLLCIPLVQLVRRLPARKI